MDKIFEVIKGFEHDGEEFAIGELLEHDGTPGADALIKKFEKSGHIEEMSSDDDTIGFVWTSRDHVSPSFKRKGKKAAGKVADDSDGLDISGIIEKSVQATVSESLGKAIGNANKNGGLHMSIVETPEMAAQGGFKDAKDYFTQIGKAYTGGKMDSRLEHFMGKAQGSDEQMAASDPYGGFLVPELLVNTILSVGVEMDPSIGRMQDVPMGADVVRYPARVDKDHSSSVTGGVTVGFQEETQDVTLSRMKLSQIKLEAHEMAAAVAVTNKLMNSSPQSIPGLITSAFADETASEMLEHKLHGHGVGQPLGIYNAPCRVAAGGGVGGVLRKTVDLIDYTDVLAMMSRAHRYSNCIWMANHDTIPQIGAMSSAGGGSLALIEPKTDGLPITLAGRPIYFSEYVLPLDGDVGDLILVDWSQYLFGMRNNATTSTSAHVRFLAREEVMMFTFDWDAQPWWKTALTPRRGSANFTLSPIVTLGPVA